LVGPIGDLDLIGVPCAGGEPLIIDVVLLARRGAQDLDLVYRARAVEEKAVGFVLACVSARLVINLDFVTGIDSHGGGITRHIGSWSAWQHWLARITEPDEHTRVVIEVAARVGKAEI